MTQSTVDPTELDDRELLFRRAMTGATDIAWDLGYDDEALAALHDVIEQATVQREAGENRRGDLSE